MERTSQRPRAPRAPAYVHAAVLTAMVLIFAIFLLTVPQQDGPPAIAEVAPNAVQRILQAPPQQAVQFGKQPAPGGHAAGPGNGGGLPASNTPLGLSTHACVGNPPTQIDDPQSPPCVPYWQGNNGGATAPGVTATTINIALFDGGSGDIINFFNSRFEFYGRKLNVISNDQGQFTGCDPNSQQAEAVQEVNSPGSIFAGLNLVCDTGDNYYKTLANLGRMGIISYNPMYPQSFLQQHRPYLWQYAMSEDQELVNTGEWICKRLNGQNATHAGTTLNSAGQPVDMSKSRRSFGVVVAPFDANTYVDPTPLNQRLKQCGVTGEPEVVLGGNNTAQSVAAQMQQAAVTSIVCLCSYTNMAQFMTNSDSDKYFPEWLVTDFEANNYEYYIKNSNLPADQMAHMFGLTFMPRELRTVDDPSWKAYAEGSGGGHAPTGGEDSAITRVSFEQDAYRALLLLASGIQMAGPHLTYATFEAALQRTVFPNPPNPINAGHVSFDGGSYSMTTDGAEWWWSNTASSPYGSDPPGTYCYVNSGVRHVLGSWPAGGDPFFRGGCDHGP